MKALLHVHRDGKKIKEDSIEGEWHVGRSENADLQLEDRAISRDHLILRVVEGGVQIEKKSEFAPVIVNGVDCTTAIVKEGDVVGVGPFELRFEFGQKESSKQLDSPVEMPFDSAVDQPIAEPDVFTESQNPAEQSLGLQSAEAVALDDSTSASLVSDQQLEMEQPVLDSPEGGLDLAGNTGEISLSQSGESDSQVSEIHSVSASQSGEIGSVDTLGQTRVSSNPNIRATLHFKPQAANVTEFHIDQDLIVIGRVKECDIILEDKKCSRKHTEIHRDGIKFTVKDLGSANGTYVNGERVQEKVLSGDDVLRIGDTEFTFKIQNTDYEKKKDDFLQVSLEDPSLMAEAPEAADLPLGEPGSEVPEIPALSIPAMESPGAQSSGIQSQEVASQGAQSPPVRSTLPRSLKPGSTMSMGIPQLPPVGSAGGKQSLLQRYRDLPPKRKAIWTVFLIAFVYFMLIDEETPTPNSKKVERKVAANVPPGQKTIRTFESLSPEEKTFVEKQYQLGVELYKSKTQYDKALFELRKIFELIPEYKDARDYEQYAEEGKRRLEVLAENAKKEEEDRQRKLRISELVDEVDGLMRDKKYDQAEILFNDITVLDPENPRVQEWKQVIEDETEKKRQLKLEQQRLSEVMANARVAYSKAVELKKQGKCVSAVDRMREVLNLQIKDKAFIRKVEKTINDCNADIKAELDPILAEAKDLEGKGEALAAYKLYKKATEVDPRDPMGFEGMERIKNILHEKAKVAYTEAVIAESYSDFELAKKKYIECMDIAPENDIYHERAKRKLGRFENFGLMAAPQGGEGT